MSKVVDAKMRGLDISLSEARDPKNKTAQSVLNRAAFKPIDFEKVEEGKFEDKKSLRAQS